MVNMSVSDEWVKGSYTDGSNNAEAYRNLPIIFDFVFTDV